MLNQIDSRIMEVISAHSDGLTAREIVEIIYPDIADYDKTVKMKNVCAKCQKLFKAELITKRTEYRRMRNYGMCRQSVWGARRD